MIRILSLLALTAAVWPSGAQAQLPDTLSVRGRIYILTTLPGDRVYSRYGHTAIRILDVPQGLDVTFNYGVFDFNAPGFVWNFAHGEMDYFLDFSSTRRAMQAATIQDRLVRQQLLDLSREQRDRLYTALLENARPENRTYRYDFLFDNCATRPFHLLAEAVGEAAEWDSTTASGQSFRQLLDPYHADDPLLDLGTDLVLGARLDETTTWDEETFLPLRLESVLGAAWINDQHGRRPLVLVQDTLMWAGRPEMPARTTPWPLIISSVLSLAGLLALRRHSDRTLALGRVDRWLLLLSGLLGLFLLYMATMTAHSVTGSNFNLMWALPTNLIAWFFSRRHPRGWIPMYLLSAALLALLSLTGGWLLPQPLPTAVVPLVVLLAVRFGAAGLRLRKQMLAPAEP